MTKDLHQTYIAIFLELDVDLSGDTRTCPNACLFIGADNGWLGALTPTAVFMGIFAHRVSDFPRTGSIPSLRLRCGPNRTP
jgi:hypothetical protein